MKLAERNKARELRYQGYSMKQIASLLNVSKGSASNWVRDIHLQKDVLFNIEKQYRIGREKARQTRLSNIARKHEELYHKCKVEITPFSARDIWIAGLMLYAGEGNKSSIVSNQHVELANSDPNILRTFIHFLIKICCVPREKIKVRLILYVDINSNEAHRYWSEQLNIPLSQFRKSFIKPSYRDSPYRHLRRSQYGTAHVCLYDVKIYRRIMGWLKAIYENINIE
jgi:transcriptional regulator with XRE-family HTH domain